MKAIIRKPSRRTLRKQPNRDLEREKLGIVRVVTYAMLPLVYLVVLTFLYLLWRGKINADDVLKNLILGGAIGGVGTLIGSIYKSWLKPKE